MACNTKTVGVSWDPYDKYVACLRFDNTVFFESIKGRLLPHAGLGS